LKPQACNQKPSRAKQGGVLKPTYNIPGTYARTRLAFGVRLADKALHLALVPFTLIADLKLVNNSVLLLPEQLDIQVVTRDSEQVQLMRELGTFY